MSGKNVTIPLDLLAYKQLHIKGELTVCILVFEDVTPMAIIATTKVILVFHCFVHGVLLVEIQLKPIIHPLFPAGFWMSEWYKKHSAEEATAMHNEVAKLIRKC